MPGRHDDGATELNLPLHALAHARAGDKGNRLNVSVIPYRPEAWDWLCATLTEEVVQRAFGHRAPTAVHRYLLPRLPAMNIVLDGVLEGGVNRSLALDRHGKTLAYLLLSIPVRAPRALVHPHYLRGRPGP